MVASSGYDKSWLVVGSMLLLECQHLKALQVPNSPENLRVAVSCCVSMICGESFLSDFRSV
jgi:hypothetical protein